MLAYEVQLEYWYIIIIMYATGVCIHGVGIINLKVLAWPGRRFNLPLTGTDEFGNPTVALSRFNVMDKVRITRYGSILRNFLSFLRN